MNLSTGTENTNAFGIVTTKSYDATTMYTIVQALFNMLNWRYLYILQELFDADADPVYYANEPTVDASIDGEIEITFMSDDDGYMVNGALAAKINTYGMSGFNLTVRTTNASITLVCSVDDDEYAYLQIAMYDHVEGEAEFNTDWTDEVIAYMETNTIELFDRIEAMPQV